MTHTTGYIVQDTDGIAIHGIGETPDEAWAETVDGIRTFFDAEGAEVGQEIARTTQFETYPATPALLAEVAERGGAIAWDVLGGIAHSPQEIER